MKGSANQTALNVLKTPKEEKKFKKEEINNLLDMMKNYKLKLRLQLRRLKWNKDMFKKMNIEILIMTNMIIYTATIMFL